MPAPITNTNSISNANPAAQAPATVSPEAVSTMPQPATDPLTAMLSSGDVGSAIAAMMFKLDTDERESARTARDAAYSSMETTEKNELSEMKKSSDDRFVGGSLIQGASEAAKGLASIGGGIWSNQKGVHKWWRRSSLTRVEPSAMRSQKHAADGHDRNVERDKQAIDEQKQALVAEDHKDDMDEANKAIDKATQFYQDWINSRNAERQAALHRS